MGPRIGGSLWAVWGLGLGLRREGHESTFGSFNFLMLYSVIPESVGREFASPALVLLSRVQGDWRV